MKILVINGDCITFNSSANLCHLAYIKGLVDSGHDVTLLSSDGKNYEHDKSMVIPAQVKCYSYDGMSLYEKLSNIKKKKGLSTRGITSFSTTNKKEKIGLKTRIKKKILSFYGIHGIYSSFVKKAKKFKLEDKFDYVISLSTPVTSHLVAHNLIKSGNIKAKHWIQIWEDPWYSDVYGFNEDKRIYEEEKRLLSYAEHVCYVSPLTLKNQQKIYYEYAPKMYWQPLPYYYKSEEKTKITYEKNIYGYFGEYWPDSRNLQLFYEAAKATDIEVNICGNPSGLFEPTEKIHIYSRLPLEMLKPIEDNTNVLIFLCNRKGGQIPGKIYQYSATNKVVLFILDGTEEEQKVLREYFEPFNRYVFCNNTKEDIIRAIKLIEAGEFGNIKNEPLEDFNPKETIRKILDV